MASRLSGLLAGAGLRYVLGFKAALDECRLLGVVQMVDTLDDACLDGPAVVECFQACVSDVWLLVEPMLDQFIVLREACAGRDSRARWDARFG